MLTAWEKIAVMGNFYFMFVSTFLITAVGTFVTDKIVEPRLESFNGELLGEEDASLTIIWTWTWRCTPPDGP